MERGDARLDKDMDVYFKNDDDGRGLAGRNARTLRSLMGLGS